MAAGGGGGVHMSGMGARTVAGWGAHVWGGGARTEGRGRALVGKGTHTVEKGGAHGLWEGRVRVGMGACTTVAYMNITCPFHVRELKHNLQLILRAEN
jgi:hypothetical protein